MRTRWLFCVAFAGGAALYAGGSPLPEGPQFQVNSVTTYIQHLPAVASAEDGRFVVVWASETSEGTDSGYNFSIQGQRFKARGVPVGPQFQINSYTTSSQHFPSVSMGSEGGFVVVWMSDGSYGQDTGSRSIQGQRYSPDGAPVGAQFQVNSQTTGDQRDAAVDVAGDGTFVVVWDSSWTNYGQDVWNIQAQRFAADGSPSGAQFQVGGYPTSLGHHREPEVAAAADGSFVVVWHSYASVEGAGDGETDDSSIQARRFGPDGAPAGVQFQVNSYTSGTQELPAVAASDSGFVIVWESYGSSGGDTSGFSVQARRYAADGTPLGMEFQVNSYTPNDQRFPEVATSEDGGFVVTWMSDGSTEADTAWWSIQGQRFSADGLPLGEQFEVNSYTTSGQMWPAIAMNPRGDFVVAWTSYGSNYGDTSYGSIQGQRFRVSIFLDGFETGTTGAWSITAP